MMVALTASGYFDGIKAALQKSDRIRLATALNSSFQMPFLLHFHSDVS